MAQKGGIKNKLLILLLVSLLLIPLVQAKLKEDEFNEWAGKDAISKGKEYIERLGTDAVIGQEMSDEMQQIVQDAQKYLDPQGGDAVADDCKMAANLQADWNLNELSREYLKGGLRTVWDIIKNILSFGSSGLADFLKDIAKDKITDAVKDYFDTQPPEVYTNERQSPYSICGNTVESIIWDKKAGTFEIFISGDCQCKKVAIVSGQVTTIELRDWVVYLSGKVKVDVVDDKITYSLVDVKQMTNANCGCPTITSSDDASSTTDTVNIVTDGGDGGDIPNYDKDAPVRIVDKSTKPSLIDRIRAWFGFGPKPVATGPTTGTGTTGDRDSDTTKPSDTDTTPSTDSDTTKPGDDTTGKDTTDDSKKGKDTKPAVEKSVCGDKTCAKDENCQSCRADCQCDKGTYCYYGECRPPKCNKDSDCPPSDDACKSVRCVLPGTQYASCEYPNRVICINGDGCCPTGCTYSSDTDCPKPIESPPSPPTTTPPPTVTPPTTTPSPTTTPPPPPDCIWTCGNWGECPSSGTQTRTCTSSPSPCTGENPNPTSQACTPPAAVVCDENKLKSCLQECINANKACVNNCPYISDPQSCLEIVGVPNCNIHDPTCLNGCSQKYQNCITTCHTSNPPCTLNEVYAVLQTISG